MTKPSILMILTSNASIGDTADLTGVWFEELAAPYYAFVNAGATVTLASIAGGPVPVDPRSLKPKGENEQSVERFLADQAASAAMKATLPVADVDVSGFDAVFLPGGHGTMWDLPASKPLATLLGKAWESGKVIAALCHGPAGLVSAKDAAGEPLVKGRRITAFTDSEEHAVGLANTVPFLLETRLRELGCQFECGPNFQPYSVRDGNLVTGQNPASSALVANGVLAVLHESASQRVAR